MLHKINVSLFIFCLLLIKFIFMKFLTQSEKNCYEFFPSSDVRNSDEKDEERRCEMTHFSVVKL